MTLGFSILGKEKTRVITETNNHASVVNSFYCCPHVEDPVSQSGCCVLCYPSGAAGGCVSDPAAAATKRAAAPHAERSADLHPELPQGGPVTEPAVLRHGLPDAGQPGGQPVRPAGQPPPQTRGE